MALNLKRAANKNKADEAIEKMESSSASYANELANLGRKDDGIEIDINVAKPDIEKAAEVAPVAQAAVHSVMQNVVPVPEAKIAKPATLQNETVQKETASVQTVQKVKGRRGRRPKAECGEVCRVQFSSTLTPELLTRIKAETKQQGIPLSCFIEKVFTDYFRTRA